LIATRMQMVTQPLRIRIIDRLDHVGESSVQQLADALDATQQNVSRHLGLLYGERVVRRRQDGRLVWYSLADARAFAVIAAAGLEVLADLQRMHPPEPEVGG